MEHQSTEWTVTSSGRVGLPRSRTFSRSGMCNGSLALRTYHGMLERAVAFGFRGGGSRYQKSVYKESTEGR